MKTPLRHHDAIVVGAGIAGCAAAIRLAELGWDVLLVERNRALPKRLAGELLHPLGQQQLLRLGVRDAIRARDGQPISGFAVFPESDGPPQALRYAEVPNGAPRGLGMHHTQLVGMLRERAEATPGVTLRYARVGEVTRSPQGRVTGVALRARGAEQEWVRARLVIGADGRHSRIRESLDIHAVKRFISYSLALTVPTSALPLAEHGHVFLDLPAPTLLYPISSSEARLLFDIPGEPGSKLKALLAVARERYFDRLPAQLREAALAAVVVGDVALAPNYHIMTRRCVAPGAALVGDAAGCTHPLTASGMTAGLNDVDELAQAIASTPELDLALERYQRQRYRFVRAREILAHALYESFLGDTSGSRAIREGILVYWQKSPLGRAFTMGLLAGSESHPGVFMREYLKVAVTTFANVMRGGTEATTLRERGETVVSVVQEATAKLTWTLDLLRPRRAAA